MGYIFDFQHKHLPHFFSEAERARRDADFGLMLDKAKVVVVNARDVIDDIERFHPNRQAKVVALPFSPAPTRDAFVLDVHEARRKHEVVGPYFIICNQFWKHKDHATAFRAFAAIAKRYPDLSLVCTGATSDYRFPSHFQQLMEQAARDGVAERIRVLGLIPKPEQLALLRGAVALIQPTLFEGGPGGGSVYDAVALGQHSIVSDIRVNREISEDTVTFFPVGEPEALSSCMEQALDAWPRRTTDQSELVRLGQFRRRQCGIALLQAIYEART